MRRLLTIFLSSTWVFFCTTSALFADEPAQAQPADYPPAIGEIFGKPVLKEDFEFVLKTVGIFNVSSQEPKNDDEKKSEAWKHLIFLREAESRKVDVNDSEVQAELTRLFAEKNIQYGSLEYHEFVKHTFSETSVVFESRMRNLLRVKKMIDAIMHPPPPTITEADAKQKFLNQYNSMLVEFANFPTLDDAKAFYKKMSKKKWDEEKKKNSKFSTPTGHISLEALIDLWQVPQADAYRIHALPIGSIAEPAKMYKGYGVFRITEKKTADLKEYTTKKKEEYLKVLEQVYYYDKTQRVIQDIIKRADMKDYANDKIMVMQTSQGVIEIRLFPSKAPKACENFIKLSENNYYNGTVFHRVIKGFMIQGGDPTATGTGGQSIWGKPFEDEVWDDLQFDHAGLLAMANSGPTTNGSQFFITVAPTPHLNKKHTIFGEVISGYEHVKAISETATGPQDKPVADQKIIKLNLKKWPTSLVFNS